MIGLIASFALSLHQGVDYDNWRYRPGATAGGPAAELFMPGWPRPIFRVACEREKSALLFEYFVEGEITPKAARAEGLSLEILTSDKAPDFGSETYPMKAFGSGVQVQGRLKLTAAIAKDTQRAFEIGVYGLNGPTNTYWGGKSLAFRRLVRECMPGSAFVSPLRGETR